MQNCRQKPTHKLDEFAFMDYKKPLGNQQDLRTSTYMGNKYITDTMLGNEIHIKYKDTHQFEEDRMLIKHRISDYKANYDWKYGDPEDTRNPKLDKKFVSIKPFYESKMKFIKRPMLPASSVSHTDYLWKSQPSMVVHPPIEPPSPVVASPTAIDHSKHGYSKYLDSSATTYRLDYYHRTPSDIMNGVGADDCITFWNWRDNQTKAVSKRKDWEQCDKYATNDCVKRRREFVTTVKYVPNSGLTTEVRSNFIAPILSSKPNDTSHIRSETTFQNVEPSPHKTEYSILGSGENTLKYV